MNPLKKRKTSKHISQRESQLRSIQAFIRRQESFLQVFHTICFDWDDVQRDQFLQTYAAIAETSSPPSPVAPPPPPPPPPTSPIREEENPQQIEENSLIVASDRTFDEEAEVNRICSHCFCSQNRIDEA